MDPPHITAEASRWADSVLNTMSYREKIGQLFMVATFSDYDQTKPELIDSLICNYHIGGLMFLKGTPLREAQFTNRYQRLSKIPLLISMDAEWGVSMRLDSTIRFPRQMTLGAMANDTLIYAMGKEIGRQCKRLGIHVSFSPDIDINNNPANPVINTRSFSDNKNDVAQKGLLYMNGLQDNNIVACGKHFPGHGNTDTDSHFALPVINQPAAEIDTMELMPFRKLIDNGLASVMVAHLFIPSLDTTNQPSTLSRTIVTDLLKEKLNFKGLVFTDALNMKGAGTDYNPGSHELKALQAGNDVLLYSENVSASVEQIHYAIQNCDITQEEIDEKVKKQLMVKYWAGLNNYNAIDYTNLISDLNTPDAQWLNYRLYRDAMTVLFNKDETLPVKELTTTASLVVNDTVGNPFQVMLNKYADVKTYRMEREVSNKVMDSLITELKKYDRVILSIHNTNTKAASGYGVSDQTDKMIDALSGKTKLIVCLFGNTYCLNRLPGAKKADAFILSYEDTHLPQLLTAQIIYGSMGSNGNLPVSPSGDYRKGDGFCLRDAQLRMKYTLPQEENYAPAKLAAIDSIAAAAISAHAMPGCVVLVAHNGKVIVEKAYGCKTYENKEPVKTGDLYDIASVTKIAATALAAMKLYDDGKIDLDKKISKYLPELKHTNKKDIVLRDMLAHQAGLKSWIPFYQKTMADTVPYSHLYRKLQEEGFATKVADSMYIQDGYDKIIWKEIMDSPVEAPGKYVYSDLGMLIMQRIIEKVSDKKLDGYVEENFYKPLGLHNLTFKPLEKNIARDKIVPTELDTVYRKQLLRGTVHDPAAAMLGGVAGNAGVFSDASSLAVIMQMLLNYGTYGGKRYIDSATVALFTARQFATGTNRRGLFFDKPEPDAHANGPTAISASPAAFGHTGFTGTCAWADPENKLVYIFLSNRVYPDAANKKLAEMNIRTEIMQKVYEAGSKSLGR